MKPQVFTEPSLNVFELPVFADANIWSMWPSDKLNELAEDIRENGFDHRYPITIANVEGVMMLLDGRNRREAARIAAFVVAEIGEVIETHLSGLGLLVRDDSLAVAAREMISEKAADTVQGADLCPKCNTVAVKILDGCATCFNCGDSK